jgi:hypothetical protein
MMILMNKIIALVLVIFSALLCVSCNNTSHTESTVTTDVISPGSEIDYPATTAPTVIATPYLTFEEMCENATDVVVARIIEPPEEYSDDYYKYTIEISETVVGDASGVLELYITSLKYEVYFPDIGKTHYFTELDPETYSGPLGEAEYLFILTKSEDVYRTPQINYTWSCATVIPLDLLRFSDMYHSQNNLIYLNHFTGIDPTSCTRNEMIEYVCSLTEDNPPGRTLSDAVTLKEIVADAPAVLQVKPTEMLTEVENGLKHTEIWHCEIVETLKGDITGEIQVMFFADIVEAGEEYIVAAEMLDGDVFYSFITKDSLRPVSEKEEIKAYAAQNN